MLQIENCSSLQIQTIITFFSDVRWSPVLYRDARNWKQILWANSTTITFYSNVRFSVVTYRDARIWIQKLWANSNDNNFYSDVRVCPVVYRDARNWKQKLWGNSNDINFFLGCTIVSLSISRRSQLKTEARSKFKRQQLLTQMSDWVL